MKNNIERECIAFHDRARSIMLSLYNAFRHSVASIDRQGDENVFQQLQGKYVSRLRHQLQSITQEMIGKTGDSFRPNELNHSLTGFIEDYVKEFLQKIKSL